METLALLIAVVGLPTQQIVEVGELNHALRRDGEELTHLPDCTGWDWEPPDTSLEASIEFVDKMGMSMKEREHVDRIIAAAREWDELKQKSEAHHRLKESLSKAAPDPGEGWELCSAAEGSQSWNSFAGKWMDGKHFGGWNRRRIEPQTFAEHVEEINELGLGYHGPKEKP